MEYFFEMLKNVLNINTGLLIKIIAGISLIIFFWIIKILTVKGLLFFQKDIYKRYSGRKLIGYFIFVLCFILLIRIWFTGFHSAATFLGFLSAGIAIALKDFISNIVGWLFIVWRRPFDVGDRIQIGNDIGDVIDIRIFQFTLLEIGKRINAEQSTGRVIHVPNGKVMIDVLANYTKGFRYIWNEIDVLLTFESDWKKAKDVLMEIGGKHALHLTDQAKKEIDAASKKYLIFYTKLTPMVYVNTKESGVLLTLRFLCEPKSRRITESLIWQEILEYIEKENDIDLAYPTTRYYYRNEDENKWKK